MAVRIYKVILKMGEKRQVAMVRATTATQAVKHVISDLVEVKAANSDEVANHMEKGGTIKNASEPVPTTA